MKPQRKPPKPVPGRSGPPSFKAPPQAAAPLSPARRRYFRLALLLGPFLLLGMLELGLRLAGYGYPTAFFLPSSAGERPMLTDNSQFGWRFFPREVARAPRPQFFPAQKPPGTVRIFVLGESAAMGDPEPAYGFARQLERLLEARHPDQHVEVINAAMTAINSHVIRQIARDCRPCGADFWLVLAGNNEVIGPYGAGTVFGKQGLGLTAVRLNLALRTTRVGQWLAQAGRSSREPANWEGLELFLGHQVPQDDPRLATVYANFAANLTDLADWGRQAGATVLFATVPVNLRDSPPFASRHRPDLRPDELADWDKSFTTGTQAQAAGQFEAALTAYHQAAKIDGGHAQLIFQRAQCESELHQAASAEADFRLARDLDTLRFRSDSRINDIIRQVATAHSVGLTDADRQFAARPGEGVPGNDLFYDHVHLNFAGNYLLARLFASEMEPHWPGPAAPAAPWLTEAEVARRLGDNDFDQRRVDTEMRARLQQPPFNAQSNFRPRDAQLEATIAGLAAPATNFTTNYESAIALAPDDWVLHAGFARLLEAANDAPRASNQWLEVTRLLPHSALGWASVGRLARLAGDPQQAADYLGQALQQQPDSVEALTESGMVAASRGYTNQARQQFQQALRLQPGFSPARVNLGLLLAHEGDATGAAAEYREALRWHTNNVDARINLANLLSRQGQAGQALALYEEAVELQPENPITRYNLGRLQVASNRPAEAVQNFKAALQQRPEVAEIHFELGNALAHLGQDGDALAEFGEAARLKPALVDARFNYGVALARVGRYPEAAEEFRETLRLRPGYPGAQQMLEEATHEKSRP